MLQLLNFKDFWSEIGRAVMSFNSISDVLDVILVTFVIYSAIKLIRETKAVQLAKGFILLLIVYALVNLFGMQASNYILSLVFYHLYSRNSSCARERRQKLGVEIQFFRIPFGC